jgi:hypothetical protein
MSDRYEISITPEEVRVGGCRLDFCPGWWVAAAIRQQSADLDQLRAELAAAVAERDEARTAYQVRSTEWHRHELIALALAERYKLRAEKAEARIATIDAAPVVAWQDVHDPSDLYWRRPDPAQVDTRELIARPAKD